MNTPTTHRVVCVVECPTADALLRQHCENKNKTWHIAFEDLMEIVTVAMEGKQRQAYFMLEQAIGVPLFHPAHYGNDTFSEPATSLVDGLALALKHALPKVHPNKENIVVKCNFLQVTDRWFVFDVILKEPPAKGVQYTVTHF